MNTGTAVVVGVAVLAAAALGYMYLQNNKAPQLPMSAAVVPGKIVLPQAPQPQQSAGVGQVVGGLQTIVAAAPQAWNQIKGAFGSIFGK